MRFLKEFAWVMYYGFAIMFFCDITFAMWQFYAFLIPLILLVEWKASNHE